MVGVPMEMAAHPHNPHGPEESWDFLIPAPLPRSCGCLVMWSRGKSGRLFLEPKSGFGCLLLATCTKHIAPSFCFFGSALVSFPSCNSLKIRRQ